MTVYWLSFVVSICFLFVSDNKKQKKNVRLLSALIGLSIPTLLAGLRKVGVGTDTEVYTNVLYNAAMLSDSFFDYLAQEVYSNFQHKPVTNWELGYNLIVYIGAKITGSIQGVFLLTHAVILNLVYWGTKKISGMQQTWFAMATFYFLFYGFSLNLMRQWLAVSILYYGFHFLQNGQYRKYILIIVVATQFHYSGAIGILVAIIYLYFVLYHPKRIFTINEKPVGVLESKLFMLTLLCIIAFASLAELANILASINAIFARYSRLYINGNITIMPMQIVRRLPLIILLLIEWKGMKERTRLSGFLYGMFIMDMMISQLGGITDQTARIGYYFSVYEIVLYSELLRVASQTRRKVYASILFMYYCMTFYYDFVLQGRAEIVPYVLFLQK